MQTISSERLILRPFTERDVDDLYRYAADPNVGPRAGWKPHESREESLEIIQTFLRDDNVWAIEQKATIASSARSACTTTSGAICRTRACLAMSSRRTAGARDT